MPILTRKYYDSKPTASKLLSIGSVGSIAKYSWIISPKSKKSKAAISITYLKNIPALDGIEIWKRGIMTMSCWVLIMAHSWLSEADIKIFSTKLEAIATFELEEAVARTS